MNPDWVDLFDRAPVGYLVMGEDGAVEAVNETFLRWSGLTEEAVLGAPLTVHLPVGDQLLVRTTFVPRLVMDGAVDGVALEVVGGDGVRRAALLSATRVAAHGDGPVSYRVVLLGAHGRRRHEQGLQEARRRAEESEARQGVVEAELRQRVRHDPLTGLLNRTGLVEELDRRLRAGAPGCTAVLLLDLDSFKTVNDDLGHAAGDDVLRALAGRLGVLASGTAVLGRLAGDEFVLVRPVDGAAEVAALARRVLDVVAVPTPVHGQEVVLTGSVGITLTAGSGSGSSSGPDTPEALLRRADIAMYRAKGRGRGEWSEQGPDDPDPAHGRVQQLSELRRAISTGELVAHHQPRVELATGRTTGTEALVRWEHPRRGPLAPAEFIPLAESSGLVRGLGARVLDLALAQAAAWRDGGHPELARVTAVNLSTRQLGDPGLLHLVRSALDRHGVDPRTLTLEITETALARDPEGARGVLEELSALGVRLAVDDFGTGYASLTYLKQLPITELKVDRLFVSGVTTDPADRAIVAACVQLAHAVGATAVAEGVETVEQRHVLRELGCDVAQGFLFSRPLPAHELERWSLAS